MKKVWLATLLLPACGESDTTPAPRTYGGDRLVELQVPEGAEDSGERYPLVMLLHGYTASGLLQTAYLGLADVPANLGAFYLAPDGTIDGLGNRFWNASDACCGDEGATVDDVAYLGGLIDDVMADWPVDPSRVVLIGHSNGHFMSYRMACERADVVTAIVGLAGAATTIDGWTCDPSATVSSLHVHGTLDETVPYEGSQVAGFAFPGAVDSVMEWAGHDGCGSSRSAGTALDLERQLDGAETAVEIVDGCPAGVGVELWSIVGGSHLPRFHAGAGERMVQWGLDHPRE